MHNITGIRKYVLLQQPLPDDLGPPVSRNGNGDVPRIEVSEGHVGGWASALWHPEHADAVAYLREVRGLADETIRHWELGYSSASLAITLPVRDEHRELVGIKRRFLAEDADPKAINSRGLSALYPLAVFADDPPAVVLCEGEFDALLLNQHGLPAVTPTTGTQGWVKHPEWSRWFVGRYVAVLYDAGSYDLASERASQLRHEGARQAWAVDLAEAGLREDEDVTDWFVRHRKKPDDLRHLINDERRRSRQRRAVA